MCVVVGGETLVFEGVIVVRVYDEEERQRVWQVRLQQAGEVEPIAVFEFPEFHMAVAFMADVFNSTQTEEETSEQRASEMLAAALMRGNDTKH